jgi:hypothetical protein
MNPPYSAKVWADLVPRYMGNLIEASARAGARLVALDNVYMLGRPNGKPLTDDTPMKSEQPKGRDSGTGGSDVVRCAPPRGCAGDGGRASDFYGPGGRLTQLGDYFWPRVFKGRSGQVIVDPDMVHTYHYIPDVAAGLATLGSASDDAFGKPWMLPCRRRKPSANSCDVSSSRSASASHSSCPGWMQLAMSVFIPPLRETGEMRYQWEEPFVIDDSPFRQRFGVLPEDADAAAAATVAWARTQYGR